ncbi:hypothetical protein LEMLEM_LOCUS11554 [Lemmus lemmus]
MLARHCALDPSSLLRGLPPSSPHPTAVFLLSLRPTWGQKSRLPAASLPPVTSVQLLLSPKTGIMVLG